MLEFLLLAGLLYIVGGLGLFTYLIIKTYEILGVWRFDITRNHIGMFEYPYWLLSWLHWLVVKANGFKR